MRRAILSLAAILATVIIAFAIFDYDLNIVNKSEAIRVVLEDMIRDDPIEGSLLVVSSPQITGLTLPQSVGGVQLVLLKDELSSWDTNSASNHAIRFDDVSIRGWAEGCRIQFTSFGVYRGLNIFVTYELMHVEGVWVIDSKVVSVPV
jgi:hypothetical protein